MKYIFASILIVVLIANTFAAEEACNARCPQCSASATGAIANSRCPFGCGGNSWTQCSGSYSGTDLTNCLAPGADTSAEGTNQAFDGDNGDCTYANGFGDGACECPGFTGHNVHDQYNTECCAWNCDACTELNSLTTCTVHSPSACNPYNWNLASGKYDASNLSQFCPGVAKSDADCAADLGVDAECHTFTCVEGVGCEATPVADGTSCSNADICTVGSTCTAGVCSGTARDCPNTPCRDAVVCDVNSGTADGCVLLTSGPCEDGDLCTTGDTCDGTGTCIAGSGTPTCEEDSNPCSEAACISSIGCTQVNKDNESCSDNDECTVNDVCIDTVCVGESKCTGECQVCDAVSFECVAAQGAQCARSTDIGTLAAYGGGGLAALFCVGAALMVGMRKNNAVEDDMISADTVALKKGSYTSGVSSFTRGPGTVMAGAGMTDADKRMTGVSTYTRGSSKSSKSGRSSNSRKSTNSRSSRGSRGRGGAGGDMDDAISIATSATRGSSRSRDTMGTQQSVLSTATRSSRGSMNSRGSRGRSGSRGRGNSRSPSRRM